MLPVLALRRSSMPVTIHTYSALLFVQVDPCWPYCHWLTTVISQYLPGGAPLQGTIPLECACQPPGEMTCEADCADCPDDSQLLAAVLAALLTLAYGLVCSEDADWMPMRSAGGQDGNQLSAVVESRVFALGRQPG